MQHHTKSLRATVLGALLLALRQGSVVEVSLERVPIAAERPDSAVGELRDRPVVEDRKVIPKQGRFAGFACGLRGPCLLA